ncbi:MULTISPECIES: molybdopterin dinucleotide binding domain-containing protein [Mycobacterium]|uniref:molybdopterin dinucleotide binding domain-containing protein n=1 Tax=Mycobacterium TaxID=1763 RepID=UPI0009FA0AF4
MLLELPDRQPGIALVLPEPAGRAATHILHSDGKIQLAAPPILEALHDIAGPAPGLVLIGRRELTSINSWMHNIGSVRTPRLYVNPVDAERDSLRSSDEVELSTATGSVRVLVDVTDKMAPGVVSYPHGWGHSGGWQIANERGKPVFTTITGPAAARPDDLVNRQFKADTPTDRGSPSSPSRGPGRDSATPPSSPTRPPRRSPAGPSRRPCAPRIFPCRHSIMLYGSQTRIFLS